MEWVNIITNVGVPIGCMLGLAAYVLKRDKREAEKDKAHADQISALMVEHKEEIKYLQAANGEKLEAMTAALNNNTLAITRLCERIEKGDH